MKTALCVLIHHKPWLVMSTLISVFMQNDRDFDLHFIFIKGDGKWHNKESYKEFFEIIRNSNEDNRQLSDSDNRLLKITSRINHPNVEYHEFENDHGLDSGAWYKFIRKGVWKNYDYLIFLQEGTILTRQTVISAIKKFVKKYDVHFLAAGHEKRMLSKWLLLNYHLRGNNVTDLDRYKNRMLEKGFKKFCKDDKFAYLFQKWPYEEIGTNQNHVPDVFFPFKEKYRHSKRAYKKGKAVFPIFGKIIYEDTYRRKLTDVIDNYIKVGNVIFHKESNPYYFGCSCQHILSNSFLKCFSEKIEKFGLYDTLDMPFIGASYEIIWGMIPAWLGYEKWFFDGIHRVRKNFVNYKREDNPMGMCHYLNSYYKGKIWVEPDGDYIKIKNNTGTFNYLKKLLGEIFY